MVKYTVSILTVRIPITPYVRLAYQNIVVGSTVIAHSREGPQNFKGFPFHGTFYYNI